MITFPESFGRVADQDGLSVYNLLDDKETEEVVFTTHGLEAIEELR